MAPHRARRAHHAHLFGNQSLRAWLREYASNFSASARMLHSRVDRLVLVGDYGCWNAPNAAPSQHHYRPYCAAAGAEDTAALLASASVERIARSLNATFLRLAPLVQAAYHGLLADQGFVMHPNLKGSMLEFEMLRERCIVP